MLSGRSGVISVTVDELPDAVRVGSAISMTGAKGPLTLIPSSNQSKNAGSSKTF